MKKRINILSILIIITVIISITFTKNNSSIINSIFFKENNTIKESYETEQVKLFAISLETKSEYIENIKSTPITCKINVDRITKVLYMDGEEKLGEKNIVYKTAFGELLEPTKTGYTFEMWTNEEGKVIDENFTTDETDDYPIYANWNIVVSNLTVNPNGGTWNDSTGNQEFNLEFEEEKGIEDPTRVGYTFKNWEVTGELSTIEDKKFKMGTENATIKAIWEPNTYTLTINPNQGVYEESSDLTKIEVKYDSITTIKTPNRKGYTFIGWTVSNGTLNGNNFTMNYTGDVTLTANWKVNNYKYIVYHNQQSSDGSSYNKVANDTITGSSNYGTTITPKVNKYTGFASPSEKSLTIDVDTDPPTKNILNYNYERNKYTLTVNPNSGVWNGKTTTQNISLFYEQTYTIPNPTKTGYNFTGWQKTNNDSTLNDQVFKMGLANTALQATWSPKNYTLTYSVNGGNALSPSSKTITYDAAYGSLPNPTRTGYRFDGWYTAPSGGSKVTSSTIHRTENNVTIYAHWTNTAPTTPNIQVTYTNSGTSSNGIIKNGSETAKLTVKSTDAEDGTPTISIKCTSGRLCNSLTITKTGTSTGQSTFNVRSTDIGVGVLEVTATDKAGLKSTSHIVIYVYSEDKSTLVDANYTNTTYDSGWLDYLEGCYISNFTFKVKFASGHSNSSATDTMVVYGRTESGKEVVLYTWTGNMLDDLHQSDLSILNSQTEKIRQIRFYTYSPHDSCAKQATIQYSLYYTFDINLLESNYKPIQ